jgi:hypothetical protein
MCAKPVGPRPQAPPRRASEVTIVSACDFDAVGSARCVALGAFYFPGWRKSDVQHLGFDRPGVPGRQRRRHQQQRRGPRPLPCHPAHGGRRLPRGRRRDAGGVGGAGADKLRLDGVAGPGGGRRRLRAGVARHGGGTSRDSAAAMRRNLCPRVREIAGVPRSPWLCVFLVY